MLEVMTRVSNNIPVKKLTREQIPTRYGDIYLAYGLGKGDNGKPCWHGMWAFDTLPVKGSADLDGLSGVGIELLGTKKQVRQSLFNMAWMAGSIYADNEVEAPCL